MALYDDTVDETVTADMIIDPEILAEIQWIDPDDPTAVAADTCDVDPQGARAPQCGGRKAWAEWRCLCQVGGINCAWTQVRVGHQHGSARVRRSSAPSKDGRPIARSRCAPLATGRIR